MVDFTDALLELGRRGLCNTIATRQELANAMQSLTFGVGGVRVAPASLITVGSESASNFLNCPASMGPYPALPPDQIPFTGGQCPGTQYSFDATWTANNNPESSSQDFAATGPVIGLEVEVTGPTKQLLLVANGGIQRTILRSIGTQFELTPGTLTLRPPTNGPDNCGNPPGTPTPVPLDYDLPDGTPTSEMVTVVVGPPRIGPNGNIVFPVRIQGNGLDVEIQFNSDGSDPRIAPPNSDPDATECCPSEGADGDSPTNDEPDPPDSDRRIIGVKVVTTSLSPDATPTRVLSNDGPRLYVPRLGTVSFGVNQAGQRSWLNPIDIKNKNCYIPCPLESGAVDVEVLPVTGVALNVNPIYAEVVVPP